MEIVAPTPDADAQPRESIIARTTLASWVETLARPRSVELHSRENRRTANWIAGRLRAWGYRVEFQGPLRNVVALPETRRPDEEVVLVGAHYDSVPATPGADDNASGVAALLACAQAAARADPTEPATRRLGFVAFNAEEDGLAGSLDFVDHARTTGLRVSCAHVLEMVGYTSHEPGSQRLPPGLPVEAPTVGDFIGVVADGQSHRQLDGVLGRAAHATPDLPVLGLKASPGADRLFPVLRRSDHAPFWSAGVPALMWTDTAEFRNPHYHQAGDLPETLDYGFLERVATLVLDAAFSDCVGAHRRV